MSLHGSTCSAACVHSTKRRLLLSQTSLCVCVCVTTWNGVLVAKKKWDSAESTSYLSTVRMASIYLCLTLMCFVAAASLISRISGITQLIPSVNPAPGNTDFCPLGVQEALPDARGTLNWCAHLHWTLGCLLPWHAPILGLSPCPWWKLIL